MNPGALFCLLLAHFVADFPLQFKYIVNLKNNESKRGSFRGNVLHGGVHLILSTLSIVYFWSWKMILVVITITMSHIIIDTIKSRSILQRPFRKYSISIFLLDQIAHMVCIYLALYTINRTASVSNSFKTIKDGWQKFAGISLDSVTYNQKMILSLVLLVIGLWGIGVFIRLILGRMSSIPYKNAINLKIEIANVTKSHGATDGGFIIGILERFFIIISITLNMPIVIGFILTVKSVARLKKFDDERFVEIFIIGSFGSFISAIIIGYGIKLLQVMPY